MFVVGLLDGALDEKSESVAISLWKAAVCDTDKVYRAFS